MKIYTCEIKGKTNPQLVQFFTSREDAERYLYSLDFMPTNEYRHILTNERVTLLRGELDLESLLSKEEYDELLDKVLDDYLSEAQAKPKDEEVADEENEGDSEWNQEE